MISGSGFTPSLQGLQRGFQMVNQASTRLSTGFQINRGADDPAGLITSENLRAVLAALDSESRSLERTGSVARVADGALSEVSGMLAEARGLAVQAANGAGVSDAERDAIQMEMDSILSTVDRLTGGTTFSGNSLLDGTAELSAGGQSMSIDAMNSSSLGEVDTKDGTATLASLRSGGTLSMSGDQLEAAVASIESAISQVASMRGEIGAFERHAVGSRQNSLAVEMENIAAAESQIRDTDFAAEISELIRGKISVEASLKAMSIEQSMATRVVDLLSGS